ncbi:MAG: glycoside hydrolase family 88 protein [Lachnospiraceae bacterium]|nr:glycoside hydrolase family 88 protein [Lachnospiraceae bacterium]
MTDKMWAEEIANKIFEKEKEVVARNYNRIPYTTEMGKFDDWSGDDKVCWWTNGFWAGMLWQLYHAFSDSSFMECAIGIEEKLDKNLMNYMGMDHDSGFKWLLTSGANFKLTQSEDAKNRFMLAAGNLAGRLNLKANLIRAWNDPENGDTAGWAIIDCMMNLPLLYKASELTKDPRFTQIATAHASRAMDVFIREDGSSHHIITFDPDTGNILKPLGGQGMEEGSSWTRGQSWALYGFGLSYHHTKNYKYLNTAIKVADYILSKIPTTYRIPVDYCQAKDLDWEDDTAAAITASGLLLLSDELSDIDEVRSKKYRDTAVALLKTLAAECCNWESNVDHILENCSAAYHDDHHNFAIIYGDYYFTEAILRLCKKEIFLW